MFLTSIHYSKLKLGLKFMKKLLKLYCSLYHLSTKCGQYATTYVIWGVLIMLISYCHYFYITLFRLNSRKVIVFFPRQPNLFFILNVNKKQLFCRWFQVQLMWVQTTNFLFEFLELQKIIMKLIFLWKLQKYYKK